jgi:hypothetical protein
MAARSCAASRLARVLTSGVVVGLLVGAASPAHAAPEAPVLCLDVVGAGPVDAAELRAAVRARIAREAVRVEVCTAEVQPAFLVRVQFESPERVVLELRGPSLDARRTPYIAGLGREEVAQTLALTAADAVRQPLDALLLQLGHTLPPGVEVCPAAEPCAPCAPCAEPPAAREAGALVGAPAAAPWLGLRAEGGPALGPAGVSMWLALGGELGLGPLWVSPHVGVGLLAAAAPLTTVDVELGLTVGGTLGPVSLGLGLAERLTVVTVTGTARADGTSTLWTAGFGAVVAVRVLALGPLELGVAARGWLWPGPARLRVEGAVAREAPPFEVSVYPALSLRSP